MKRILLRVAYDGTDYHGYQSQENGNTIEAELLKAITELTGESPELLGGSRTDAGVHAEDNVVVFDTESSIPGMKFSFALNSFLPEDIRITSSREVDLSFHPRHCDTVKTYEYRIENSLFDNPIKRRFCADNHYPLNIEAMQKAAELIVGEHDFSSFCSAGAQVDSKVRTVYSCNVRAVDSKGNIFAGITNPSDEVVDILIRISGNGFLYNMVRIIAGTLMEVGRGAVPPESISEIIELKDRQKAGPTAPARGLVLKEYRFIED